METYQFIPTSSCFMKMYKYKFLHYHNSTCMPRVSNALSVTFIVVTKDFRRTRGKVYLTHGFKSLVDCQLTSFVSHHDAELDGAKRLPQRKPTHLIDLQQRKKGAEEMILFKIMPSHDRFLPSDFTFINPQSANILCNHQ